MESAISRLARQRLRGCTSELRPSKKACRAFSVLHRPPPNYPGHVPLTRLERAGLAVGSAVASMVNHYRHVATVPAPDVLTSAKDMVAALGEATAQPYFIARLRKAMLTSPTGRRILRDRPRMSSATIPLAHLRTLPANTLGAAYVSWLDREHVSPDTRDGVRYIDDAEEAYVMQRYRESHDLLHALTGLPVIAEGEIALKAFEFANTVLPMTGLSVAALVRLPPKARARFWEVYGPWAVRNGLRSEEVINVYWEEEWATDVQVLRERLGVEAPPDLREWKKRISAERKRVREANEGKEGPTATV